MSYLQLDDGILDHPKFVRALRRSAGAVHLWLGLMIYCKKHLTDGLVPLDMLPLVHGPAPRWRQAALDALLEERLVERSKDGGLLVHDYLDWNLSKAEIERKSADRKAAAERRRKGLENTGPVVPMTEREQGERRGDDRVSVGAASELRRTERLVVSNDVVPLSARATSHGPARARKTETETETEIRSDPPVTPPALTLEASPQIASTSSAKTRTSRKPRARCECPTDFQPDETTLATATSLGFKPKLELETRAGFVDWWRGKGLRQADWQATYRNWLRKTAKDLGLKPPPPDTPQHRLWLEQKRRAEAPPVNVAPHARETIDNALSAMLGKTVMHAAS